MRYGKRKRERKKKKIVTPGVDRDKVLTAMFYDYREGKRKLTFRLLDFQIPSNFTNTNQLQIFIHTNLYR